MKCLTKVLFSISILLAAFTPIYTQSFPPGLLRAFPESVEKLGSEDPRERAAVLKELVEPVPQSCTLELRLRRELSKEDYSYVAARIIEKGLKHLQGNEITYLTYLIGRYELVEFAPALSAQMAELKWDSQYAVLLTLKGFNAVTSSDAVAELLGSDQPLIRREALETLIRFKSKRATPRLIELLFDESSNDDHWAMEKLAEIGAVEAGPKIAEKLKSDDENLPYWAIDAIGKLDARAQAKDLWQFRQHSKNGRFKGYALAVLLHMEQKEAVPLLIEELKLSAQGKESFSWEFVEKIKPKILVPALIELYRTKEPFFADEDTERKFRWGVFQSLVRYRSPLAIPIYRENLIEKPYGRYMSRNKPDAYIAGVLQELDARETLDDMIAVFNEGQKPMAGSEANYGAFQMAGVIAKFGEPRTWKMLVDLVEKTEYVGKEQILIDLNKRLDPKLWERAHKEIPKQIVPIAITEIPDKILKETGIPIAIDFVPQAGKKLCTAENYEGPEGVPCVYIDGRMNVFHLAGLIVNYLNNEKRGEYTFIFDNGTIRILKTSQAVAWWRKTIL